MVELVKMAGVNSGWRHTSPQQVQPITPVRQVWNGNHCTPAGGEDASDLPDGVVGVIEVLKHLNACYGVILLGGYRQVILIEVYLPDLI